MKGVIPEASSLAINPPGYRIKYYRLQNKMTQKDLAEKCGLTESAIRNYELGNRSPSDDQRAKIAEALNVSVHAIDEPNISKVFGMMHVLFDIEKIYGIAPKKTGDKVTLSVPSAGSSLSSEDIIYNMMRVWAEMRRKYDSKEIDLESYIDWQSKYPEAEEAVTSVDT